MSIEVDFMVEILRQDACPRCLGPLLATVKCSRCGTEQHDRCEKNHSFCCDHCMAVDLAAIKGMRTEKEKIEYLDGVPAGVGIVCEGRPHA